MRILLSLLALLLAAPGVFACGEELLFQEEQTYTSVEQDQAAALAKREESVVYRFVTNPVRTVEMTARFVFDELHYAIAQAGYDAADNAV